MTTAARTADTRAAILDAGSRVFADEGVAAASVGRIAAAAGVTRPTVYAYFDTKDALFHALVREVRDAFLAIQEVPDTTDPHDVARTVVTRYLELYVRHLPLLAAIDQRARTDPDVAATRDDLLAGVHRRNARFVDRLARAGRADPALDPPAISQTITGIVARFAVLAEHAPPAVRARLADDAVAAYVRLIGLT